MIFENTLCIIKPDAIKKNIIGSIYFRFQQSGFKIKAIKMVHLTQEQAKTFYNEHKKKIFFNELIYFITSKPIILHVLHGKNIIKKLRNLMGSTNPKTALTGTIRSDYSDNILENTIHGSDSRESAKREINLFFKKEEIFTKI